MYSIALKCLIKCANMRVPKMVESVAGQKKTPDTNVSGVFTFWRSGRDSNYGLGVNGCKSVYAEYRYTNAFRLFL